MWDVPEETQTHLSHDRPCPRCGHGAHSFGACSPPCPCGVGGTAPTHDTGEVEQVLF